MDDKISEELRRSARNVITDLRELATLTSTPQGAQRVAWGPVWKKARGWLQDKVSPRGLASVPDAAGNNWVTLPGESSRTVIIGGHLDSVPNGGRLGGTPGVLVALGAPRRYPPGPEPARTPRPVRPGPEKRGGFGRRPPFSLGP